MVIIILLIAVSNSKPGSTIHPASHPVPYFLSEKGVHAEVLYICAPILCIFFWLDTNVQIFQLKFLITQNFQLQTLQHKCSKFSTPNFTTQMLKILNSKLYNFIMTFFHFEVTKYWYLLIKTLYNLILIQLKTWIFKIWPFMAYFDLSSISANCLQLFIFSLYLVIFIYYWPALYFHIFDGKF